MTSANARLEIDVVAKDAASKVLKDVGNSASGLGKTLSDVGKIAGGFIAANVIAGGAQAAIGFFNQSVDAAKDLGESLNAVNKIFGDQSQVILDWGKNNATQFGLSQRAFNQLATPLGAMLKNSGIEDFSGATIELTKRAADMASVFNVDVDEALTAIQAGLRGESDPLERFGVGLSAAKVEARALADTGKAVASALTDQEKATARLAIIFDQTNSVAGDFAATSDDLANKTRIQQARQEELAATIGTKLLPIQLKITEAKLAMVNLIATKVIPVLEELYQKHWPAVQEQIDKVVAFVRDHWPEISAVIAYEVTLVKNQITTMVDTILTVIAVGKDLIDFWVNVFQGDWRGAWDEIQSIVDRVVGFITRRINGLIEVAEKAVDAVGKVTGLGDIPGKAKDFVGGLVPFAEGTPFVPATMPALLHRGEAVIPASMNPYTHGGAGGVTINIGTVYGFDDFERKVAQANRNIDLRGGGSKR